MSINNSKCALFLCPKQHDFTIENTPQFIAELQNCGLIASAINDRENSFYTGERYLDFIAYMGCAPAIQFEASDTRDDFCHINIHQHASAQLIVSQMQTRAPHCPNCSKPVKDWLDNRTQETIHCSSCNNSAGINEFDWRKMGGYSRIFIEITDIFPKEAIPQQILFDKLTGICKTDWSFFYSCQ